MFTLGIATHTDFSGLYFTVQCARLLHPDIREIVVIDNAPGTAHSQCIKDLLDWKHPVPIKYIPYAVKQSTTVKNEIFKHSTQPYTIVVDSHVILLPGSIAALRHYFEHNAKPFDLVQGPLLYDDLITYSTHLKPEWRTDFFGTWDTRYTLDPFFEIPMHGGGCFSCKTSEWLGFNNLFQGFGGEEGYIQEKYRQRGGRCMCLQELKWLHRFGRPEGTPYVNILPDRYFNYFVGRFELNLDCADIFRHVITESKSLNAVDLGIIFKTAWIKFFKTEIGWQESLNKYII